MAQVKTMPLEFFLTLKNERDAIAQVRTVGLIGTVVVTLAAGYFVVTNRALGAACFVGTGIGAVAASYKEKRYLELIEMLDNVETYEVESRQDIVVNHLGGGMVNQTIKSEEVTPIYQNATLEQAFTPQSLEQLNFHHLMILAPTGFGKSTVANYILDQLNGDQIIVDPHATPRTWGQLPVAGQGRNYDEIQTFFELSLEEMNHRYQRRNNGDTSYPKLYILIDEFPAIAKAIGGEEFREWVQVMLCEARKVNISLILLSQGKSVKTLGLEGQSELLENLTIIRGKGFAKSHARSLKDEVLECWLSQQERPATIDDDGLIVPDLSKYRPLLNTIPTDESLKLLGGKKAENFPSMEKPETKATQALPAFTDFSDLPLNAVREALENGKPDSHIVMDILEYKGRKYSEGKKLLTRIKEML